MKEVTYEEWIKNPTPRMMWVWDDKEEDKVKAKVVHFINADVSSPVVIETVSNHILETKHCAEIEGPKTRRMTNKELARWLREKPTREYKNTNNSSPVVYGDYSYMETESSDKVDINILIREDDGEWREPLVEVEE